ncbi:MAG: PAS domain S-box protein [Bryobacteraceae bacterium]
MNYISAGPVRSTPPQELLGGDRRFRLLADAVTDFAFIFFNPENQITGWSAGAQQILGWKEEEILGESGGVFFTPEERAQGAVEAELATALNKGRAEDERWHVRKNGTRFWGSGIMTPIRDGALQGFIKVLRDTTAQKLTQQKLAESEARLRDTFAHAAVGMALTDLSGRFTDANPTYCRIVGRTLEQLRKLDLLSITHLDDRARKAAAIQKLLTGELPTYIIEKRYVLPDGGVVWVRNSVSALRNVAGEPKELIVICEDVTTRVEGEIAREQQTGENKNSDLRALAARLVTADEEQRRHIAYALHEDAAQRLAALRMEIEALPQKRQELSSQIRTLTKLADDMSVQLRELSYSLYPPTLEHLGLDVALRQLVNNFARHWTQSADYASFDVSVDILFPVGIAIYRITEEALRNVAAHAPGASVSVTLAGTSRGLELTIVDTGPGFVLSRPRRSKSLEIISMQERVRLLGGRIRIRALVPQGTQISIIIPLSKSKRKTKTKARVDQE